MVAVLAALALLGAGLVAFASGCGSEESGPGASEGRSSNKQVLLNITVEDVTQQRRVERFLLRVPGDSASWAPDLSWGGASRAFGAYRVGREHVFYVQTDSSSRRRVEVPFEMQPDMISGVAASKIRVTLYDDSLVARGPAIQGGRMTFER
jgi:hypothetical protein